MTKRTSARSAAAAAESHDTDMHGDGQGQAVPAAVTSVTAQATEVESDEESLDPGTPPDQASGKSRANSEEPLVDYNEVPSDEEILVHKVAKKKTRK